MKSQSATKPKFVSVILSTYNAPAWLEKSVWGYAMQRYRDFELVIADDGSGDETREMIEKLRRETELCIKHVWHPDNGFQKCTILNLAIQRAEGDYLVFSDGDCIPRNDFLNHHFRNARRGNFLSGGYYKLPMNLSRIISIDDICSKRAFRLAWLKKIRVAVFASLVAVVFGTYVLTIAQLDYHHQAHVEWE